MRLPYQSAPSRRSGAAASRPAKAPQNHQKSQTTHIITSDSKATPLARKPGESSVSRVTRRIEFHLLYPWQAPKSKAIGLSGWWVDPWFMHHVQTADTDWSNWIKADPAVRIVVVIQEMVVAAVKDNDVVYQPYSDRTTGVVLKLESSPASLSMFEGVFRTGRLAQRAAVVEIASRPASSEAFLGIREVVRPLLPSQVRAAALSSVPARASSISEQTKSNRLTCCYARQRSPRDLGVSGLIRHLMKCEP